MRKGNEVRVTESVLVQAADESPQSLGGVEVLGHDLLGGDHDVEFVIDLGDEGDDVQRIEDAVLDEAGLGGEIHVGVEVGEDGNEFVHGICSPCVG